MSRQLKKDTGERKLRVTLLSAEWRPSSYGDPTTINRELAIQMAKHPNVEVSVFLPQCSEKDKKDADSYNVKLIEAVKLPGSKPVLWLASVPDGHAMDCVLGHGVALGQQIPLIKRNPNYSHCKWIQVVYTAPEEIGMYKSISEGQQMQQMEKELCEMADQVVTIGPKLTDAYKRQLGKKDVFNLMPSIFSEFLDVQQASDEGRTFCVLVIESGDSEDFDVQGYGIAAEAIANLKSEPYQLKFASKQRGKEDELKHKLLQCGIGRNQLLICSFDENKKTLVDLFSTVDIAIFPSKAEGFGLSALKAISAGLPVLVSGNSGIAEALREVPTGPQCIVDSEEPADWSRAIKAVRNKKRNVRLEEAKILREKYLRKFSWEEPCDFLVETMYNLACGGELNITVGVEDSKPEEQNMQTGMLATESARYQEVQPPRASATSAVSGSVSYSQREHFEAFEKEIFLSIARNYLQTTPPHSPEERNSFKEYMKEMRLIITGVSVGSLVITVKCESLMILKELWTDYSSGRLGEVVQNCFVTEKILKELNLAELRLKTTIDVKEYNACKMFFEKDTLRDALSSEFHSTSSTSESPQKKEQWEKSGQKTKIMETGKLEGTSALTVVPTTGHGKELEEPWGRKGMLPLPGSSTFDPEEQLEEPHLKLQRMEGTSPSTLLSTSGHKRKLEVRHSTVKLQEKKGMLPLPGSSTFDPEEELGEPHMKLQRMEAVAKYSEALKESMKSQTEYLAQASPTMSKVRTDDIFTNILMQHGRKPVEEPHVKRKKRLRRYGQTSGKQIKSSQEIFIPTDGKRPKSVLVTGKAGIGKTLFCQKLIRDWADNKLFRSRTNAEVPDFKYAYLLTFRQLNLLGDDPFTLEDILNRSSVLDDHSNMDDSIFEYIVDHSEEVLIIIDGYDECSQREYITGNSDEKYPNNAKEKMPVAALCAKLIKGKIMRGSVVMITSRPDESDEMKAKDVYFDRYVEITGFSEPQVKKYIGKYFKNNDRMKNIVMDHITKNVNLVSFAHIPVLCFLMCSYFEYTLQQPKKNNPLPVKTSDLYDEVVNMFVQKHDRKKSASVEETLDELSKLAAQLLLERKFLFLKEDLKTLNLHELESLCGSGLLHCGPPFRTSFSATTKHFCFTHLTLQEYLAARWFVKTRTIPPRDVSTEVVLFMSGILSKQKDNEFEEKLIIHKFLSDDLLADEATRGHLISKCLLQYEDIEFAKGIVKRFHDVFCIYDGCFDLSNVDIASLDYAAVPFTLNVFGALNAEDESEWSRITELRLTGRKVTDAGVASLSQALQKPTCKVTVLDLDSNQITNAGVASLCQALQTPTCEVTKLDLSSNKITDAGVASLSQALQTPTCNITSLDLDSNQITDASVTSLCQALQTPTCEVTRLNLEDNKITDAGVVSLSQALQTTTCKVTELFLSSNLIADAGVVSLSQALQTPTSKITKLSLDDSRFTVAAVASLCQALQTPTCKVTLLHLSGNRINDACVAILSQALRTPTCKVTDLALGGNQITSAGVASLCQALQTPTCKVTELHLSANQIADAGAASLCQALQTPTCKVTKLLVGNNQITDAGVVSLSQALQTPTCKVTELVLSNNQITDAGVASLSQALQTPTCKVTKLFLNGNQITDAGVASLSQALQTPTCKVTDLYLAANQVTDTGVASLCQALQAPTCKVTELNLIRNQITDAGFSSLCQALQTPTFTVTKLYLRDNQITDAGIASLLQASKPAACKVFF